MAVLQFHSLTHKGDQNMQIVKQYPNGVFSWVDLGTTDTEGAKVFYGGLFGWSFLDIPTDSGVVYSMAQIEGHDVAGLGPLSSEMQEQGIPPHWSAYVKHDDVDAVVAKASEAGGTVLFPPFDVMDSGRMTMIQDPTGAVFGVWQPKEHIGAKLVNIPNTLTWNELQTHDPDAAREFYAAVFGCGTLLVVIDNLRYDQMRVLEPIINEYYKAVEEKSFFSILPSATQYARNAIFSGLLPLEMEKKYPQYWKNDTDEGGKNLYENEFLTEQIKRLNLNLKHEYFKITTLSQGRDLAANLAKIKENDLTVVVYNFVDMLSHSRTEMEMIKELASDDKAYRSLTVSWFKNSPLLEIIQNAQKMGLKLIITTDHGTINTSKPSKVVGDKNISSNLRYKTGKSLSYNDKEVYAVQNPKDIGLPTLHISSSYIFAKEDFFFAYPNNYNHYVKYYKNTYQHGGVSLEEMIIPCVTYLPK